MFKPRRKLANAKPRVVVAHDASFAGQPRQGSQQGVIVMMGYDEPETRLPSELHTVEWSSGKIHRVVRSTLAAEAASAATAVDRAKMVRHLVAQMQTPRRTGPKGQDRSYHVRGLADGKNPGSSGFGREKSPTSFSRTTASR